MADEGWSYAIPHGASACSTTAPVTDNTDAAESATSTTTSTVFQPSLHDGMASSSSSSFLADPRMDWTPACMQSRGGRAATTSFNALLQLHGGDAGSHFLLDPTPPHPHVQPQYDYDDVDGTATRSATSLFADNQFSSSVTARSCGNVPAAAMMKPFPQQEQPPILSQALVESKRLKCDVGGVHEACSSVTRRSSIPDSPAAAKKPRIEAPSPLPTFKVRKEKLGDRITALQQLVSPFGKTDTASVLHEAIEYIKFLHDQVASLSSPYLRCGRPVQPQKQQGSSKAKDGEAKKDLRSRGLCLVPVASTYTVANETAPEFWHSTFGGTFR